MKTSESRMAQMLSFLICRELVNDTCDAPKLVIFTWLSNSAATESTVRSIKAISLALLAVSLTG